MDSIDPRLRNRLWNTFSSTCKTYGAAFLSNPEASDLRARVRAIWHSYFERPLDTIPDYWPNCYQELREYFFHCGWNEVYDFLEFIAGLFKDQQRRQFTDACNLILENDLSAYRFVGTEIVEITSPEEISSIEEATGLPTRLGPAASHIARALELMADRKNRDYRNSIKESISAIEAVSKIISGNKKVSLAEALRDLGPKIGLHPAQVKAFEILYGFTSDAHGIRHALLDQPSLSFEDAKFMLVACSAFVNYLVGKLAKSGLQF